MTEHADALGSAVSGDPALQRPGIHKRKGHLSSDHVDAAINDLYQVLSIEPGHSDSSQWRRFAAPHQRLLVRQNKYDLQSSPPTPHPSSRIRTHTHTHAHTRTRTRTRTHTLEHAHTPARWTSSPHSWPCHSPTNTSATHPADQLSCALGPCQRQPPLSTCSWVPCPSESTWS